MDFSECEFIHREMTFYTFDDFYRDRKVIKQQFEELSKNGKRFYMWYLFSNTHTTLGQKNKMWDFLNGYINSKELYILYKK